MHDQQPCMHESALMKLCACAHVRDAGMVQEASTVLQQLVHSAVTEGRFRDAARHNLQIGLDALAQVIIEAFPAPEPSVSKQHGQGHSESGDSAGVACAH